jgi:hypothetical protein
MAAEMMGGALARVRRARGAVKPETDVEKFAQKVIGLDRSRDFNKFMREVGKVYEGPGNVAARKEAGEYFGAYYYAFDAQNMTVNPGTLAADPVEEVKNAPPVDVAPDKNPINLIFDTPSASSGDPYPLPPGFAPPSPAPAGPAAAFLEEAQADQVDLAEYYRAQAREYFANPAAQISLQALADEAGAVDIPTFLDLYGPDEVGR